ncbi:MAG: peptidase M4 [Ketobacter sp.]|nr:peptidase M4 [Ketobacter sp.]
MKTVLLFLVMLASTFEVARADSDYDADQLRSWVEQGRILPLEDIIQRNQTLLTDKIVDVELEHKQNRFMYEIKVLSRQGQRKEMYFDGATGEHLKDFDENERKHH